MRIRFLAVSMLIAAAAKCQTEPEFPKGNVFYLGLTQGKNTAFNSSPDLWVGSFYFSPQFTVVPGHLRLGADAELVYTGKRTSFFAGPRIAWRIKTLKMPRLGSVLNLQLQADYLKGTKEKQCLYGGNFTIEFIQMLAFDLSAHREGNTDQWWFRAGLGIRLFYKKNRSSTGRDPLDDDDN